MLIFALRPAALCPIIALSNSQSRRHCNEGHKEYEFPFKTFLTRIGSFCIHVKNLQKLMTEIYNEKKHVSYNLRIKNVCKMPQIKTQGYGHLTVM